MTLQNKDSQKCASGAIQVLSLYYVALSVGIA